VPKFFQIGKCLLKLQLKMLGMFFETQCIDQFAATKARKINLWFLLTCYSAQCCNK